MTAPALTDVQRLARLALAGIALRQDETPADEALALALAITGLDGRGTAAIVRLCRCGCGDPLSDAEFTRGYRKRRRCYRTARKQAAS